jgi:FixJ family two-component response regulator
MAVVIRQGPTCDHNAGDSQAVIAIVDDEESICNALSRLMRSAGFKTMAFTSGHEFMARAAECKPDCVVLDLHMPGLDGFEIHARLQSALQGANIPIIILTADSFPDTSARALEKGAYAFLRKPVDDVLLLAAVNAALAT